MNIWDVNADNIDVSKSFKRGTNSNSLIGYSDKAIRPFVLIKLKMS